MIRKWLVQQVLLPWLRQRVLVLPQSERTRLARKLGISEDIIIAVEERVRSHILEAVEEVLR
ncbi:MAG: hypothetical protein ACUVTY_02285 [Armatimonadota bacterium]